MNFIRQAFSEDNGSPSSMRLFVLLILAAVLVPAVWSALKSGQPLKLDWDQVGLILGTLGVKTWQKGHEQEKPAEEKV